MKDYTGGNPMESLPRFSLDHPPDQALPAVDRITVQSQKTRFAG